MLQPSNGRNATGEVRIYEAMYCHDTHMIRGYLMTAIFPGISIKEHEGNKYLKKINDACTGKVIGMVDVYEVLLAFNVTDPGLQHAIKKLLCAGLRGKGNLQQDLVGAIAAINRSIDFAKRNEQQETLCNCSAPAGSNHEQGCPFYLPTAILRK